MRLGKDECPIAILVAKTEGKKNECRLLQLIRDFLVDGNLEIMINMDEIGKAGV